VVECLQHQHTCAFAQHEAVAPCIPGTGNAGEGERAHGVEAHGRFWIQFLGPATDDHVLAAGLQQFHGLADGMRGAGAGGADQRAAAADTEGVRKAGGQGAGHAARHDERREPADAAGVVLGQGRLVLAERGIAAHDDAAAPAGERGRFQFRFVDGFAHGVPGVGGWR